VQTKTVRLWCVVTAMLLCAVTKVGLPGLAGGAAVVLGVGLGTLVQVNRKTIDRTEGARTRASLMCWLLISNSVPVVVAVVSWLSGSAHKEPWYQALLGIVPSADRWLWHAVTGLATAITATLLVSSLLDWCLVRPRLRDRVERPCRRQPNEDWTSLTQRWLGQRIVAYLIIRTCALVLLTIGVLGTGVQLPSAVLSLLGGLAALLIAYFINNVVPIAGLVTNPQLLVGDRITLAEEYGTGVSARPAYYVVDVGIEGFKLVEVDDHDSPMRGIARPQADRSLALKDVGRLLRARRDFLGCAVACAQVDRHCPFADGATSPPPWAVTAPVQPTTSP
jgi:membrane protein YqaA with SNARE-associated domain